MDYTINEGEREKISAKKKCERKSKNKKSLFSLPRNFVYKNYIPFEKKKKIRI
jgi:hypothetical protein